jgi:hypothetical protein
MRTGRAAPNNRPAGRQTQDQHAQKTTNAGRGEQQDNYVEAQPVCHSVSSIVTSN